MNSTNTQNIKTFSLLVTSSAWASQGHITALNFAKSVLKANHKIHRVFFYSDATQVANNSSVAPQDELNLSSEWTELATTNDIDLVTCISAAIKRGIIDSQEQTRYQTPANNLADGFNLSGLGQLVDAIIQSDRVVSF